MDAMEVFLHLKDIFHSIRVGWKNKRKIIKSQVKMYFETPEISSLIKNLHESKWFPGNGTVCWLSGP